MTRTKLFVTFTVMIALSAVENTQAAESIRITNADSSNVSITNTAGVGGKTTFAPLAANVETVLNVAEVISSLDRGYDVVITTSSPGTTTPGDIVVDAAILKTVNAGGANGSLLTFLADNDIIVNEAITSAVGGLDVELQRNGSAISRTP